MMKSFKPGSNIFQQRVPIWLLLVFAGAVAVVILSFNNTILKAKPALVAVAVPSPQVSGNSEIHQHRLKESRFTSRLLFVDIDQESEKLSALKSSVENIIEQQKREGKINSASVYMKKWGNGEWFAVNPDEGFYTASMMKMAVMITILKMSENIPGYLDKNYPFRYADPKIAPQTFGGMTIIPGNDYKMRDLLYYMIVYSDNYASNILNNLMDLNIYTKFFSDIGIYGYDPTDQFRKMTAADVAKLFRVLYNSSYLSEANSEYALSLLTKSSFKDGLVKEFPPDVVVAHKFGEGGGQDENQLSEAGIVYTGSTSYLIVVMTRGKQLADLSQSIGEISRQVYDYMNPKVIN